MIGKLKSTLVLGKPVRYRVRRSSRTRRIGVEVSAREGLVVVLPRRAAVAEVSRALDHWAEWVDGQVDKHGVREGPLRSELTTGSELLFHGRRRRIRLAPLPTDRRRLRITLEEDGLFLELPPEAILDPKPTLERWLRKEARADFLPRVGHWAEELGLHPTRVMVGQRTSRWGSCSSRGTLSFCYRLIMAPPQVIDAIVAHEVCHLAHLNHSKRFWALLDSVCPWHRESEAWLTDHHEALNL